MPIDAEISATNTTPGKNLSTNGSEYVLEGLSPRVTCDGGYTVIEFVDVGAAGFGVPVGVGVLGPEQTETGGGLPTLKYSGTPETSVPVTEASVTQQQYFVLLRQTSYYGASDISDNTALCEVQEDDLAISLDVIAWSHGSISGPDPDLTAFFSARTTAEATGSLPSRREPQRPMDRRTHATRRNHWLNCDPPEPITSALSRRSGSCQAPSGRFCFRTFRRSTLARIWLTPARASAACGIARRRQLG